MKIRRAQMAGLFYPADKDELERAVRAFLDAATRRGGAPKAIIVPHAGYIYSAAVAAAGYKCVKGPIERVVLLGPAHRYPVPGLAAHSADAFATPLGDVRVERPEGVPVVDDAHEGEHSLEVQLPFLQVLFGDVTVVPILVGDATPTEVGELLERLWGGPETLIVISSDLSHYHDYQTARQLDTSTAAVIEEKVAGAIGPRQACGCRAIAALVELAKRKDLDVTTLDLRNSGDTAGPRDEVVGYGAFSFAARS